GMEIRPRRRQPPPAADVAIEGRESFLSKAVHVIRERIARLLHRLKERRKERALGRTALEVKRALLSAILIFGTSRETALHALEIRQTMRVVPAAHSLIRSPALIIQRISALEDHPVDAARSAEHF